MNYPSKHIKQLYIMLMIPWRKYVKMWFLKYLYKLKIPSLSTYEWLFQLWSIEVSRNILNGTFVSRSMLFSLEDQVFVSNLFSIIYDNY